MKKTILILNFLFFVGILTSGCSDSKINEKNAKKSIGNNLKEGNLDEVTIGKQIWMTKNLNVAKFRNGDSITEAKTVKEWQKAGDNKQAAWCYYNNNSNNGARYGKLYNWYAVNDSRGLAPKGWVLPTEENWSRLTDYLGGNNAGKRMKSIDLWSDNGAESGNGTNKSGFSGFPGGYRFSSGTFSDIGANGNWWSATEYGSKYAWYLLLNYFTDSADKNFIDKKIGYSVRCIKQ